MTFNEPTYEEYKRATAFAKFRYKYGLFVLILCWICLIILIYFVITYSKELSENPLIYAAKKINAECTCYANDKIYDFNSTSARWKQNDLNRYYLSSAAG